MPASRKLSPLLGQDSPLQRAKSRSKFALDMGAETSRARSTARPRRDDPSTPRPLSGHEERVLSTLLEKAIDFIDSESFYKKDAEVDIYGLDDVERPDVSWYRPLMEDLIPQRGRGDQGRQGKSVLLSADQERILFLKFNYARYRMRKIQDGLGNRRPSLVEARDLLRWFGVAEGFREQIAETNLALVLAMAKRVRILDGEFADVVSEGNMALMRSVDKFDCGRGFKFSTYACRAILKAFSRHGMKSTKYRQRFPTDFDPALEKSDFVENRRATEQAESAAEVRHIVETNEAELTSVERTVIVHRFGIGSTTDPATPLTLEQVGQIIGVTKERVRQIQNKALEKLRSVIENDGRLDPSMTPSEN